MYATFHPISESPLIDSQSLEKGGTKSLSLRSKRCWRPIYNSSSAQTVAGNTDVTIRNSDTTSSLTSAEDNAAAADSTQLIVNLCNKETFVGNINVSCLRRKDRFKSHRI